MSSIKPTGYRLVAPATYGPRNAVRRCRVATLHWYRPFEVPAPRAATQAPIGAEAPLQLSAIYLAHRLRECSTRKHHIHIFSIAAGFISATVDRAPCRHVTSLSRA